MILIVIALLSCEIEQWPDRRQDGEESPVRRAGGGRRAAVLFWSLARTLLSACLHCTQQHTPHTRDVTMSGHQLIFLLLIISLMIRRITDQS